MLALTNPFYKNPEGHALQLLQQQIMVDAEKRIQQSLMELFALRSLLPQGQLCLCVPLGFQAFPFAPAFAPQMNFLPPQPAATPPPAKKAQNEPPVTKDTKLVVCLKNEHEKPSPELSSDEYRLRSDSVEVVLDLRSMLPADISVRVEERSIRVEVNRVDKDGYKNCWRQYDLPACVHAESARCLLSHDGFLHISVPWYRMEQ